VFGSPHASGINGFVRIYYAMFCNHISPFLVAFSEQTEGKATDNNSMDVSSGQRLSYHVVFLTLACVVAAPNHVISAVRRFLVKINV